MRGNKSTKSKEIRLCLVMYGGVSLAVYMNGVSQEFYNLVRGRGVWGLFKILADVDVTVDIVSGASAGGINGLFLAYALSGEREFSPLARMWREEAGLNDILQEASQTESASSLLKSDVMWQKLKRAFEEMGEIDPSHEFSPTPTQELDCFLATTNFYGHHHTLLDFRGRPLAVKSHRGVVHLKHRQGRREPFNPDNYEDYIDPKQLASLARATSAFPFAFEPVGLEGKALGKHFIVGGPRDDQPTWFVDGGVLDNRPFESALSIIYNRHADRPVDRMLFFVEPHPVDPEQIASTPSPNKPSFFQTSLASLSTLPMYESIWNNIEELDQHNRHIDHFQAIYDPLHAESFYFKQIPSPLQIHIYWRARVYEQIMQVFADLKKQQKLGQLQRDVLTQYCELLGKRKEERELTSFERKISQQYCGREAGISYSGTPQESLNFSEFFTMFFEGFFKLGNRNAIQDRLLMVEGWPPSMLVDHVDVSYVKRAYYYFVYELRDLLEQRHREWQEETQASERDSLEAIIQSIQAKKRFLSRRIDMLLILEAYLLGALSDLCQDEEQNLTVSAILEVWMNTVLVYGNGELNKLILKPLSVPTETLGQQDTDKFKAIYQDSIQQKPKLVSQPLLNIFLKLLNQAVALQFSIQDKNEDEINRIVAELEQNKLSEDLSESFKRYRLPLGTDHKISWSEEKEAWSLRTGQGKEQKQFFLKQEGTNLNIYDDSFIDNGNIERFQKVDLWRFPAQNLSNLGEIDKVDYYRISPLDTNHAVDSLPSLRYRDPEQKLAGIQLAHFGAFLKRSWRANDIMWGRIDAATILWDVLTRKKGIQLKPYQITELEHMLEGQEEYAEILNWLQQFKMKKISHNDLSRRMLRHIQRTILKEEIPRVIGDAFKEEVERRQKKYIEEQELTPEMPSTTQPPPSPNTYQEAALAVLKDFKDNCKDPLLRRVGQQAAEDVLREQMGDYEKFFNEHYNVGAERLKDIDRLETTILGLQIARVISNMITKEVPKSKVLQGRLAKFLMKRVSIVITTLHLGSLSIRGGYFPLLWLITAVVALVLLIIHFFIAANFNDNPLTWLTFYLPIGLLVFLLGLPSVWFNASLGIQKLRYWLIGGFLLFIAVFILLLQSPYEQLVQSIFLAGAILLLIVRWLVPWLVSKDDSEESDLSEEEKNALQQDVESLQRQKKILEQEIRRLKRTLE